MSLYLTQINFIFIHLANFSSLLEFFFSFFGYQIYNFTILAIHITLVIHNLMDIIYVTYATN